LDALEALDALRPGGLGGL
jgi:hypothetical protein